MMELELIMLGIPKTEINAMLPKEIQIIRHLLSYMHRSKEQNYA